MRQSQTRPRFIGSEIYRHSSYGRRHPLAIPRVSTCIDLCRALGWLPDGVYLESPRATPAVLARFHDPAYIDAVIRAENDRTLPDADKRRFNLGLNGNPIFPEVFSRPATACGAAVLAGDLVADGGTVYSPAGGTHHGRRDRASGFCFFNDPALAILRLLDRGVGRVLYLDVDAHHADGVQAAFDGDHRVFVLSVHEAGRWPMRAGDPEGAPGTVADRGRGNIRNLPVPQGFNDSEMHYLIDNAILPFADMVNPEAIVLQCGADALEDDPLSRLSLSNRALWAVVAAALSLGRPLLVLGGGGYNPWSVGRCWAGVWAALNGHDIPARLPAAAERVLRGLEWRHSRGRNPPETWFTTLADSPRGGPVRQAVRDAAAMTLAGA
jgi:acetoin utilization protein AcuC